MGGAGYAASMTRASCPTDRLHVASRAAVDGLAGGLCAALSRRYRLAGVCGRAGTGGRLDAAASHVYGDMESISRAGTTLPAKLKGAE